MVVKEPKTLSDVVHSCVQVLTDSFPADWTATPSYEVGAESRIIDAALRLRSPDGIEATLVLEAKRILERRDVPVVAEQLVLLTKLFPNALGVVAARYLAPSVRDALAKRDLSYVDATGNQRIAVSRPGLFISNRGADKDPWRGPGRPRGTLKGAPAARVVRTLVDIGGPWRIRELIELSGASTGATYRVVDYLEREELLKRDEDGSLILESWRRLLQEWSKDYGFMRSSRIARYIDPRGIPALMDRVKTKPDLKYAVTGSLAAAEWAPYAPSRVAQIYVPDIDTAAQEWGLRPAETGANVLLAEPETAVVFDRTLTNSNGIVIAQPGQVAVDLMTGPGRNPSEAEELMDWMERNESSWRL